MRVQFDAWYRYDELTSLLEAWVAAFPTLCALESIGQSHEGREIWLVTLTNRDTGPPEEKPAFFVQAQIHAVEYTATTAALALVERVLHGYGVDGRITRALDTRCLYVVPRVSPDGAEAALADAHYVRSSLRAYPRADRQDGLHEEDVDGDGRVLMMRLRDPNGAWKAYAEDPRLLVPRDPEEAEGEFFRVLPEGTIQNYDGATIKIAPPFEGLDFNRNFPAFWQPESEQFGAGPYPTSEPETQAVARAIVDRPNITGALDYHTFSGVHLRPYAIHPDEHFPTADLRAFQLIGDEATRLTGYPAVSIFHDFKYDPKKVTTGSFDEWLYEHHGLFAWTTEFWSPQRRAGLADYHFIEWLRDHPVEDDVALLALADEYGAYVDWYPFEHPQLGPVELGGWDLLGFWANPPFALLEEEVTPHADFALFHLLVSPLLAIRAAEAEPVGDGAFRVRAVVENTGFLPTSVTEKAVERKAVRPVEIELELAAEAELASGEARVEIGQLDGRAQKRSLLWFGTDDSTSDRGKAEWVVKAPAGTRVRVVARHQRAGTARAELVL